MQPINEIKVSINFGGTDILVGRLAIRASIVYFEYDSAFIELGIEISPLHLPLRSGVVQFDHHLFEGLPGVFNDSLPDGWGRLLFDRFVRSQGILPTDITTLDRLAHIGKNGLGALVFEPSHTIDKKQEKIDLDTLLKQAQDVLDGTSDDVLSELITLNGSSAGARPKALIGVDKTYHNIIHGIVNLPQDYTPWIVKFPNNQDGIDAGAIEYVYSLMAKEAGISVPDVHLFPAQNGPGYFAIKRFDRQNGKRYHMHTACGLLHSDFRIPSLDYENLIALTGALTRDVQEIEKMYQLAVFNVLSCNRDDHSKNFSFLMDKDGQWKLAPAYDLTFSSGPRGEQSTMVLGEGKNPGIEDLLKLATEVNIKKERAEDIIEATIASLAQWPKLAKQYNVRATNIKLIQNRISQAITN
jgi:serine/threonine-protein kinase HipA